MRRPVVLAALIAVLAVVIGGGGWKKLSYGGAGGGGLTSLWTSSWFSRHRQKSFIPHCSLLETRTHGDFVIAAERVVLPDGVSPAAIVVSGGKIARVHPLSRSSASSNLAAAAALATGRKINASSLILFKRDTILGPGLVDSHVHANEPGRERWEGLSTASAAAAAGGVTTVVDMPLNSAPAATSARLLREKAEAVEAVRRRGEREGDSGDDDDDDGDDEAAAAAAAAAPFPQKRGGLSCDVGLWAGLVPSNARDPRELKRMFSSSSRGVLGFKAFLSPSGIGDFERTGVREAEAAMAVLAELGAPLLLHAELLPEHRERRRDDGDRRESKEEEEGKEVAAAAEVVKVTDLESWAASRPEEMEVAAITEVVAALARVVEKRNNTSPPSSSPPSSFRVHIAHVAAPSALPVIARAKAKGLPLSAETCPHYLGLLDPRSPPRRREERGERKEGDGNESAAAAGVAVAASLLKCAPPLRADVSSVASKKLWAALEDGTLDSVASDHSPTTPGMKRRGKEEGEEEKKKTDGVDNSDDSKGAEEEDFFSRAWGGISGLQFLLPSTWSSAPTRPATVEEEDALAEKLHRWLSSAPAALAGLSGRKGTISAGLDADFVAWKPRELADVSFAACRLRHCENSPFVGTGADLGMRGRVVATFLRGQLVFSEREEEEEEEEEEGKTGRDSLPRAALLTGCGGRLLER